MTEPVMQSIVCPVLVGRTDLIAALRHTLDAVGRAEAHVALISGEAGIGKSRLVVEAKAYAADRGLTPLQGTCFPGDRSIPYAPLLDLVRTHFASRSSAEIAAAVGPFSRDLFPLLPDVIPLPTELPPLPTFDAEQERQRLFAALRAVLMHQDAPTLLIVEDLHWCDESSLDVLLYLLRRAANHPLLVIGTYRSDEITPQLHHWLAQLDRARLAHELVLAPLTREEVARMLHVMLGGHCPVRDELRDIVYNLSEGNPFYVEELLSAMVATGDILHVAGAWDCSRVGAVQIPRSLHAAVQQRVRQLSAAAQTTLTLASVVGRCFPFALLQQVQQIDERELLRRLKELVAALLVVEESTSQFTFRHALTQQVIYTDLLARERMMLHRTIATAIEQIYATSLAAHLDDLAYHFGAAEVWDKALLYAQRAGERALRLYAPRAAIDHYTRALDAVQHLAQTPDQPVLVQLHRERGRAYETVGEFEHALADYQTALTLASTPDDRTLEWQVLLDLGLLWAGRDYTQAGAYYRRALDLTRTLGHSSLLAHSLNRVGNWHMNIGQPHEALRLHRQALAIFEQANDRRGIATTYDLIGMASYNSADIPGCVEAYEHAVALFRKLGDRQGLISSLTMLTVRGGTYAITAMSPDATAFAAAVRDGELALQEARAIEWRAGEAFALFALGWTLGPQGGYGRALTSAQRGLQLADEIGHQQWMAGAHWTLGMLYLDLLVPATARQHLAHALRLAQAINSRLWSHFAIGALALADLLDDELDQAETTLTAAYDPAAPVQSLGEWFMRYVHLRLVLARHEPALALRLLNQVSPAMPNGHGEHDTPRLATARGEALAALGRTVEAESVLRAALDVVCTQGAQAQRWRTHLALGNLYRSQRRDEAAQQEFAAAQTIIRELAVSVPDESTRNAFVRRATALLPRRYRLSPRRIEAAQFEGLTAREREVAALIGQGMSNREIADRLVIGERTVETHVSHILAKLDATSRHAIAVWAADKGLVHDRK